MRNTIAYLLLLIAVACGTDRSESDATALYGDWNAQWVTLPESFPGVEDVEFSMNGKISFDEDSVAIWAYGYEGCIFSEDTLRHSLEWRLSGDSLHFVNADDVSGMSYLIKSRSDTKIDLVLMGDIFLTLVK